MKPLVIAGNGPSLAQIDYSRLPEDFELFRCNQFYFEPKYFLGKKIKGVFFNPPVLKEQFFTLHHLRQRGEYEVEDVYCNITMGAWDRAWSNGVSKNLEADLRYDYPSVKNTYPYLEKMQDFNTLHKFFALYYEKRFTSGIVMLVTALAQGYTEIYLTGIDFYEGSKAYAFDFDGDRLVNQRIPAFIELHEHGVKDPVHSKEVDVEAIKLALSLEGVKLYALSPSSPLSRLIPLAPNLGGSFDLVSKPKGFICDFVELPQRSTTPPPYNNSSQADCKPFKTKIFDLFKD